MSSTIYEFDKETHTYKIDGRPATGITTIIGVLAKPNLIPWAARMAVEHIRDRAKEYFYDGGTDEAGWNALLEEARTAHTKKKEAAGTHGTDAHALVEEWINDALRAGGKWNTKEFLEQASDTNFTPIKPFIDWAVENVDHFLFAERQMFNKELWIAGTADFGAVMKDGKKLIGDFKTSSGVYGIDYFLQCAGYKILAEAEGDAPYDGCVIVRLGKKGPEDFDVHYRYTEPSTKETSTKLWNSLMGFLGVKQAESINYSDIDTKAFMACLTLYRAQATYKKVIH